MFMAITALPFICVIENSIVYLYVIEKLPFICVIENSIIHLYVIEISTVISVPLKSVPFISIPLKTLPLFKILSFSFRPFEKCIAYIHAI